MGASESKSPEHFRRFPGPHFGGPHFGGPFHGYGGPTVVVMPRPAYPITSGVVPWGPQTPDTIRNAKFLDTTDGRKILTGISTSRNIFIKTTPITYWSTEEKLVKTMGGATYYYLE